MIERGARPLLIAAFGAVYILWGSTYLAIALAVKTIPPFLLIGLRSLAAGAILLALSQIKNPGLPPPRAWAFAAASGVLLFGGCHGTLAYAEEYVSSGLAAVMLATIPFWIVLIKWALSAADRPSALTLAALVPGLAGVALFVLPANAPQGEASTLASRCCCSRRRFPGRPDRSSRSARAPPPRRSPRRRCSSFAGAPRC